MLKRLGRVGLAAVAAMALAETASATVYINKRYCGGDAFATCAALMLDVTGTTVTLRVWNLSGNTAASYGNVTASNILFNGLGLYNVPVGIDADVTSLTTTGPARPGYTAPRNWILRNSMQVGFLLDMAAVPTLPVTGYTNDIASDCGLNGPNQAPMPNARLFVNPCTDPSTASLADWVTFQFQVNQTWDASNAYFMVRGKNFSTGLSTECWTGPGPAPGNIPATCFTVSPEPMTMTLLATGLVGLGGLGYLRRRRTQKQL
jgi:MYXO-CTERM domain-containing protein